MDQSKEYYVAVNSSVGKVRYVKTTALSLDDAIDKTKGEGVYRGFAVETSLFTPPKGAEVIEL